MTNLAKYYAQNAFFPSHRNLQTEADLARHGRARAALMQSHLGLPPAFFRGARIGEFGPDTGENALVFASWGAQLTLVEPNRAAHPVIGDYFRKFGLEELLCDLSAQTLETYAGGPFDLVNAEGFVATIRPASCWLEAMARLTARDGLFHISFFEQRGALIELITNALARLEAAARGQTTMEAARRLMAAKWRRVGHSRPIEAWVMDHLENPAARLGAMLRGEGILRACRGAGFQLQASAPGYAEPLAPGWVKQERDGDQFLAAAAAHINRSALSFALGAKAYWTGDDACAAALGRLIDDVAAAADAVIGAPGSDKAAQLCEAIGVLTEFLCAHAAVFLTEAGGDAGRALFDELAATLAAHRRGEDEAIARFCLENKDFLALWGAPVHHAVFRKQAA